MRARTEASFPRLMVLLRALLILLLLGSGGGTAHAQQPVTDAQIADWQSTNTFAQKRVEDATTSTPELEVLREQLVRLRGEAQAAEQGQQGPVDDLNKRIEALGPAPAEGASEAPEIARLRGELSKQLSDAQVPLVEAQEAFRQADMLIGEIDKTIRSRFSAELMSRGPSPLLPGTWAAAATEMASRVHDYYRAFAGEFADATTRAQTVHRLPAQLFLVTVGLAIAVGLRRMVGGWVSRRLARAQQDRRSITLLVALRNLVSLVVPAVGAGLFFAAFDPNGLLSRSAGQFFSLPPFVMVLIGTGWLVGSLLAPREDAYRLLPLESTEAWRASVTLTTLGTALALSMVEGALSIRWDLSTTTQTAMQFPLVIIGAVALWSAAGTVRRLSHRLDTHGGPVVDTTAVTIRQRFLGILARVLRLIAVTAPVLALLGFLPAASFLVFRATLMIGLFGAQRVIYDLLTKVALSVLGKQGRPQREDGDSLLPVAVAAIVCLGGLPLLAMIWGARASDISDVWTAMVAGVTVGGVRLSAGVIVTLAIVFLLGTTLVRLLQTILRGTVLPRTRLDAGGRSAVVAGVGYVGYALAGLAAVSAAGLNLSNLAIVAGALSVGIGFGLQTIVSNFVSGIILLVERPVKEGDWIEVSGFSGYVRGINVRSTEIETFDRASVILPNSDLIAGTVLNRTHRGMAGRLQLPVGVTYDADPKKVEAILLAIADEHPLVLQEPAPRVLFMDLGPDSMNFELRCWLRDVNFSLSVRSDMNFELVAQFDKQGIRARFYGREMPAAPPAVAPPADVTPPGFG